MKMRKFLVLVTLLFFAILPAIGQKLPMKYGKIDENQLKATAFDIDKEAEAIILGDFGWSYFRYNNSKQQFQYVFERHRRVKILKKDGYSWADFAIPVFHRGGDKEEVGALKGATYNMVNGKMKKSKLTKSSIFEEKISDNWDQLKFTMPDVKEGSIIEYSYTITSDYISEFRSWDFQSTIPVLWSEYRAVIPEYFKFRQIQQGFALAQINDHDKKEEAFKIDYTTGPQQGGLVEKGSYEMKSLSDRYRWVAQNMSGLKDEPYITSLEEYIGRIDFMLSTIEYPRQPTKSFMGDYESFNKTLLDSESFGLQLRRGGFLKNIVEDINGQYTKPEEKVFAAYEYVKTTMVWNGKYRKYPTASLKKGLNEKIGNSADINLLLTLLLKECGVAADPVILSTRNNGRPHPFYPINSKFNYVITKVSLADGKSILLDATDKERSFGMLPHRCMNGKGWAVSATNSGWVQLLNQEKNSSMTYTNLTFDKEGNLLGDVTLSRKSLSGYTASMKLQKEGSEYFEKNLKENSADWSIRDFKVTNNERGKGELRQVFQAEYSENFDDTDIVYLNPVIFSTLTNNPFKLEERQFPVDYGCPQEKSLVTSIQVPEGYEVEEVPENKILALPNRGGKFMYSANVMGDKIQISVTFKVGQTIFSQQEYPGLREFYNQAVAKCSEQIVLKKKA